MKVVMQVTDKKKSEDVKKEFEGDFIMFACLQRCENGFNVNSTVLGEEINKLKVIRVLGCYMADAIMSLSKNEEEMLDLSTEFCAYFTERASEKYHEMKEKAE